MSLGYAVQSTFLLEELYHDLKNIENKTTAEWTILKNNIVEEGEIFRLS